MRARRQGKTAGSSIYEGVGMTIGNVQEMCELRQYYNMGCRTCIAHGHPKCPKEKEKNVDKDK